MLFIQKRIAHSVNSKSLAYYQRTLVDRSRPYQSFEEEIPLHTTMIVRRLVVAALFIYCTPTYGSSINIAAIVSVISQKGPVSGDHYYSLYAQYW